MIRQIRLKATVATGETGATATSEVIHGEILKVVTDVTGDSMDINLDSSCELVSQAILDYTGNTDTTFYPRVEATDNAAASLDGSDAQGGPVKHFTNYTVFGRLVLTLASAAAAETVTMLVTYRE